MLNQKWMLSIKSIMWPTDVCEFIFGLVSWWDLCKKQYKENSTRHFRCHTGGRYSLQCIFPIQWRLYCRVLWVLEKIMPCWLPVTTQSVCFLFMIPSLMVWRWLALSHSQKNISYQGFNIILEDIADLVASEFTIPLCISKVHRGMFSKVRNERETIYNAEWIYNY